MTKTRSKDPVVEERRRLKRAEACKRHSKRIKEAVIGYYGEGKCARCGIDNPVLLCIDHIEGGGRKERQENKTTGGSQFYQWLWNNNLPDGYQVLCWNCNALKRYENKEN